MIIVQSLLFYCLPTRRQSRCQGFMYTNWIVTLTFIITNVQKVKYLSCTLESTVNEKYMLKNQNLNQNLGRTFCSPKKDENIFAFWKKIRNVDYVCQILTVSQTSGERYARQALVCSLKNML